MLGFRVPSAGISIMHLLTAMPDILSATLARVFDNCIIVTLKIGKLINLNLNLITNIDLASIALQETSEETTLLRLGTQNRRVALKGIDTKGLVVVGCCDRWHQVVTKYLVLRAILSRLIGHKG